MEKTRVGIRAKVIDVEVTLKYNWVSTARSCFPVKHDLNVININTPQAKIMINISNVTETA